MLEFREIRVKSRIEVLRSGANLADLGKVDRVWALHWMNNTEYLYANELIQIADKLDELNRAG